MRDSKLASIATRLVETATEIKASIEGAKGSFHLREQLLCKTRAKKICAQEAVRAEILGMAGFGVRESVGKNLAHYMANEIIKTLDFDVDHTFDISARLIMFTAKAYILTQAELTALVDEAIEIGRRS